MLTATTDVSKMERWLNENRKSEKLSLLTPFTSILYTYSVIFFDSKFTLILWYRQSGKVSLMFDSRMVMFSKPRTISLEADRYEGVIFATVSLTKISSN